MSTLRYSGEVRIRVTLLDTIQGGKAVYRCYLRNENGGSHTVRVNEPALGNIVIDSPKAFDEIVKAALAFTHDEMPSVVENAACDINGEWHVGRSYAYRWLSSTSLKQKTVAEVNAETTGNV